LPQQFTVAEEAEVRPQIPATVSPPPADAGGRELTSRFVFVQRPAKRLTGPQFDGPFKVLRQRKKVILIQFGNSSSWILKDRIKPFLGTGSPTAVTKRHVADRGRNSQA
jgi:hypothetical protein